MVVICKLDDIFRNKNVQLTDNRIFTSNLENGEYQERGLYNIS